MTAIPLSRTVMSAPDEGIAPIFDAMIWPHDSWSSSRFRAFATIVAALAGAGVLVSGIYGLWPIAIMIVADAGALVLVLACARRSRRRTKRVTIAGGTVSITHTHGCAREEISTVPLYGLRIERHDDPDYGCRALYLGSSGRRVEVARDLSPDERAGFVAAMSRAITDAGGRGTATTFEAASHLGGAR